MPDVTDDQQLNLPSLVVILVISGLIIRYFFFSSSSSAQSSRSGRGAAADPAALLRAREAAAERIQQMFPQVDRRTALWDLQRTGGNVAVTTERILAGRLETPPITFQPPPPPSSGNAGANITTPQNKPAAPGPAHPDLITRYNLKDKLNTSATGEPESGSSSGVETSAGKTSGKGWSTNREERQSLLQKRRDQMILEARRKMEAKIAAEKAAGSS
ncbi:hypothetical protein VTI28DRAFT_4321 [Corynascus sepedonium]